MKLRGAGRSSRQQEVGKRPDDVIELVDQGFELLDMAGLYGRDRVEGLARGRCRKVGAQIEQLVLDPGKLRFEPLAQPGGQGQPDL
jgi:hypothetical protein